MTVSPFEVVLLVGIVAAFLSGSIAVYLIARDRTQSRRSFRSAVKQARSDATLLMERDP